MGRKIELKMGKNKCQKNPPVLKLNPKFSNSFKATINQLVPRQHVDNC